MTAAARSFAHSSNLPKVSAMCCTYGRPQLLEESIACFLLQDYPAKELVIVNDLPRQKLELADPNPQVRIINMPERFACLSSKRNFAVSQCQGEYVLIWDDDDLYLPWRMSESVSYLQRHQEVDGVKGRDAIYTINNTGHRIMHSLFHSQATFRRSMFERLSYEEGLSCGEDARLEQQAVVASITLRPLFWLIYRWGLGIYHMSGRGGSDQAENWAAARDYVESQSLDERMILVPRLSPGYMNDLTQFLREELAPTEFMTWLARALQYPWFWCNDEVSHSGGQQ